MHVLRYLSFNSMKVRLKLSKNAVMPQRMNVFQFHEGPIKTQMRHLPSLPLVLFQFHEGPIKTRSPAMRSALSVSFQFHEGPIKTHSARHLRVVIVVSIP